jgi:hypothetical protein
VATPAIPAPTTTTSAASSVSSGCEGTSQVT